MKTIGIIGGLTWYSTIEYYKLLNELVNKRLGGAHAAKIILYSVDFAEIKILTAQEDWKGIAAIMCKAAKSIELAGADCLMIVDKFPEVELIEFTVAPQVTPQEGLPHHEWLIEFAKEPKEGEAFRLELDNQLRSLNVYYDDLISGNILRTLKISQLRKNAFIDYMKSLGKLGGQNKVPRLSNDRKIADELYKLI